MKLSRVLIFTLILLITLGVATAADVDDSDVSSDLENTVTVESNVNQIIENQDDVITDNNKVIAEDVKNTTVTKKSLKNIKTSDSTTISLTDGNFDDYFDSDGNIIEGTVSEGNILDLSGEFNDKLISLTIPVTLTSSSKNAYLTNCLIYVGANNVNITNLKINNTDYDENIIFVDCASNVLIENNSLCMINNDQGSLTHTVDVEESDGLIIRNNEIITVGPEENLNHDTGVCITDSINIRKSSNVLIDSNYVSTTNNENAQFYGTIYGIYLRGNKLNDKLKNATVTNNTIITTGRCYIYGLSLVFAEDSLVENNYVTTTSKEYANGIQVEVTEYVTINHNNVTAIANNFTYPIYGAGREAKQMIYFANNTISNNTLYAESLTTYLIEFFIGRDNVISYNNITAKVDNGVGIGTSQAGNNLYEYNNIEMNYTMKRSLPNPDAISDSPAGIRICTIRPELGVDNVIRYNNITVHSPEGQSIPAIDLSSTNNSAYRNYLISSQGVSNEAVKFTAGNEVYDNYPVTKKAILIELSDIEMNAGEVYKTIITVLDEEYEDITEGTLQIYIDDNLVKEHTLENENYLIYDIENLKPGIHTFNVTYIPVDDMKYDQTSSTSKIIVNKVDSTITIDKVKEVSYKDLIVVTGKVAANTEGIPVELKVKFNDKEDTIQSNDDGTYTYSTTATIVGLNNITVSLADNDMYNPSTATATVKVNKKDVIVTFNPIEDTFYGQNVTITGKFTDITGKAISNSNVRIFINGVKYFARTDKTGAYTLSTKVTSAGVNNVSIGYAGNNNYNTFEANTTFNVVKQDVVVTHNTIADVKVGENITITGKFTDANGKAISNSNVRIFLNGKKFFARTDSTGSYSLTTLVTAVGVNNVSVGYAGGDKYNAYEVNTTFNVDKQDVIVTFEAIPDNVFRDNVTITGKFTDANGKAISNSNVRIFLNGKKFFARTDSTGSYSLTTLVTAVGVNNVSVGYAGGDKYNAYEVNTTFNAAKQDIIIEAEIFNNATLGYNLVIYGKLTDKNGKQISKAMLYYSINGYLVFKGKTDERGGFGFTYTILEHYLGDNYITIEYLGNEKYNANSTTLYYFAKEK